MKLSPSPLRLGAHTSIAGGLHKALERGAEAGCDVVQIFSKSNQQWAAKKISAADVEAWQAARAATGVEPAMIHDSYLINVASPDRRVWQRSLRGLIEEVRRCDQLGVPYLVMHPGAHLGSGAGAGIERIVRALDRVGQKLPDHRAVILLENTAGQGTTIGHRFEHLRDIIGGVASHSRVGVCIDTCHLLAAGHDFRSKQGWAATFDAFERLIGCAYIRAFHLNDSKRPLGSRVDRHEHIGRGALGLAAFRRLVNDPRFAGLPMTLETPKPTPHADRINLAVLRALQGKKRVTALAQRLARRPFDRALGPE